MRLVSWHPPNLLMVHGILGIRNFLFHELSMVSLQLNKGSIGDETLHLTSYWFLARISRLVHRWGSVCVQNVSEAWQLPLRFLLSPWSSRYQNLFELGFVWISSSFCRWRWFGIGFTAFGTFAVFRLNRNFSMGFSSFTVFQLAFQLHTFLTAWFLPSHPRNRFQVLGFHNSSHSGFLQ